MTETPEQRARRLGLVSGPAESPDDRAARLGLRRSSFTPAQLIGRANRSVTDAEQEEEGPSYGERFGGNVANLVRDVPGGEAFTAGVHSVLSRQPYAQSFKDVRSAEDATPGLVRWPSRIAGGAASVAALPGGAVLKGARYGILDALGQADPEADVKERLHDAMWEGAGGAVLGALPAIGRVAKNSAGTVVDVARAVGGNPRPIARRVLTALGDAAEVKSTAPVVEPPTPRTEGLLGNEPPGRVLEEPRRLLSRRGPASTAPEPPPSVAETGAREIDLPGGSGRPVHPPVPEVEVPAPPANRFPPPGSPLEARTKLAELLQKSIDEGAVGERVKGYPIASDPPTNWPLMHRLEQSLKQAKGGAETVADSAVVRVGQSALRRLGSGALPVRDIAMHDDGLTYLFTSPTGEQIAVSKARFPNVRDARDYAAQRLMLDKTPLEAQRPR